MSDSIPASTPGEPPAAAVVIHGTKSEREASLEQELQEEREKRKKRETDIAYMQDENRRLKSAGLAQPPAPPAPPPAPAGKGWTFFDED